MNQKLFNKKNLIPLHSEFLRIWAQFIVKQLEKTTFTYYANYTTVN